MFLLSVCNGTHGSCYRIVREEEVSEKEQTQISFGRHEEKRRGRERGWSREDGGIERGLVDSDITLMICSRKSRRVKGGMES